MTSSLCQEPARQTLVRHGDLKLLLIRPAIPWSIINSITFCMFLYQRIRQRATAASHFYRATACNAMHGIAVAILSVCPSVCPSVRCVYCDKTKQRTPNILIPHETAITLVFWHQQWLVGYAPFPLKSALKVTHPLRKMPTSTDFRS